MFVIKVIQGPQGIQIFYEELDYEFEVVKSITNI